MDKSGDNFRPKPRTACPICKGTGIVKIRAKSFGVEVFSLDRECGRCDGTGIDESAEAITRDFDMGDS